MQTDFTREFPNLDKETIIEILMMIDELENEKPGVKKFDDFMKHLDHDDWLCYNNIELWTLWLSR